MARNRWRARLGSIDFGRVLANCGGCYDLASLISGFTWLGAVVVMFLHHAVQPRTNSDQGGSQGRRWSNAAYRAVLPVLVSMPVAWGILNQLRVLTYEGGNQDFAHRAIITAQRYVACATVLMLPFTAALSVHWLVTRLRRPPRPSNTA